MRRSLDYTIFWEILPLGADQDLSVLVVFFPQGRKLSEAHRHVEVKADCQRIGVLLVLKMRKQELPLVHGENVVIVVTCRLHRELPHVHALDRIETDYLKLGDGIAENAVYDALDVVEHLGV